MHECVEYQRTKLTLVTILLIGFVIVTIVLIGFVVVTIVLIGFVVVTIALIGFVGIVVAKLTLQLIDSEELHLKDYLVLSVCSLSIGMGLFFVLYALGIDPMWSLEIAKKNCDRPEWVHIDTTVFSSIIHVFSMILGRLKI